MIVAVFVLFLTRMYPQFELNISQSDLIVRSSGAFRKTDFGPKPQKRKLRLGCHTAVGVIARATLSHSTDL